MPPNDLPEASEPLNAEVSKSLRQDIPLMAIRNMSFKLMNGFSLPQALKINFFGHLQKEHCCPAIELYLW